MKIRAPLTVIVLALIAVVAQAANLTDTATSMGQSIANDLAVKGIKKVAIVDLVNTAGGITAFSRLLTEEVTNAVARTGKIVVIDRLYLDRILREQNLTLSGLVSDVNAVQQVGKVAGIDALVVGSYFELGSSVRVSMKALDVKTAQLLSSTTASIDLEVALTELLKTPIASNVTANPAPTSVVNQVSTTPISLPDSPLSEAKQGNITMQFFGCYRTQEKTYNTTCFVKFVGNQDSGISFQSTNCQNERATITNTSGKIIENISAGFIDFKDSEDQIRYNLRPKIPLLMRINFKIENNIKNIPIMDVRASYDGFCNKFSLRIESITIQ